MKAARCARHSAFLAGEAVLSFFFIQSSPYECRRVAASTPAPHCVSAPDAASARDGRPLSLREPPSSDRAFQSGSTRDGRIDLTVDSLRTGPSRSTQLIFRERSQRAGHRLRLVEDEPSRRSAENLMSHDEAGTLAVSFAKLPELLRR
jgi:hypothetical protein